MKVKRLNESKNKREPKFWNTNFSANVIKDYEAGKLTFDNIEEWDTAYNDGKKPNPPFNTKEILDYYLANKSNNINESMRPSQETLDDCLQDYLNNAFGYDGVEDYVDTMYPSHPQEFKSEIVNYLKERKNESLTEGYMPDDDEYDRIDRNGSDEEQLLAAITYQYGVDMDKAREYEKELTDEEKARAVKYYNLRMLPPEVRLKKMRERLAEAYNKGDWVEVNLNTKKNGTPNIVPVKVDSGHGKTFLGWAWGEKQHEYPISAIVKKIDMDDTDAIIRKYTPSGYMNETFDVDKVQKRIARHNEFDNGHVIHNYEKMTSAEAEEKARLASIENPDDIYYVSYDNIMNPSSDIKWKNGQKISESKESEESELITQYINNGEFDKLEKVKDGTNVIWKLKEFINESIDVETIGDYITDHYDFDSVDDKYICINSIKDSFKDEKTISKEELEQFIGSHNGRDKVNESKSIKEDVSRTVPGTLYKVMVKGKDEFLLTEYFDEIVSYLDNAANTVKDFDAMIYTLSNFIFNTTPYLEYDGSIYQNLIFPDIDSKSVIYKDGICKTALSAEEFKTPSNSNIKNYIIRLTNNIQSIGDGVIISPANEQFKAAVKIDKVVHLFDTEQKALDYVEESPRWREIVSLNESKSVNEASYGGAFDIADDQYFTREDIESAAEEVMNHIDETFYEKYILGGTWFEKGRWTVNVQSEDRAWEFEELLFIDMRKINRPEDLKNKYALDMAAKLIAKIKLETQPITEEYTADFRPEGESGTQVCKADTIKELITKLISRGYQLDKAAINKLTNWDKEAEEGKKLLVHSGRKSLEVVKGEREMTGYTSESLTEDLEGPKEGPEYGLSSLLNDAIQDEFKTIDLYNTLAVTARAEGFENIAKVIEEINVEENRHVGQLQEALKLLSPNASAIDDGEAEGQEQLANPISDSDDLSDEDLAYIVTKI